MGLVSLFSIWTPVLSNHIQHAFGTFVTLLREGTLENLFGGGGEYKNSRKGKLDEKILARQLTLQNIHAMA